MNINDVSTPVVVLRGIESASHGALGIVRSLGRLGVPVYVVAPHPRTPAFFSRYCSGKYVCNLANAPSEISLTFLLDLGRKIGRPSILIPTDDNSLLFCTDYACVLREQFLFPAACPSLIRQLSSKEGLYYLAREHGLPTPEAAFPKSRQDVLDFLSRAKFPIMLKAICGAKLMRSARQRMFIVRSQSELLEKYDAAEDLVNPNLMIQEYIPGGDDTVWMLDGYFNDRSDCVVSFTGKKIRQYPVGRGSTSLGVCLQNETVRKATTEFIRKIGYKGLLDIGYRYDARDGLFKVLDINPRIGSTFRLFVADNGMDVARAMYLDLTGQPVIPGGAHEGRKWLVEDQDLISCLRYHREGNLTFRQWIDSFRGVEETAFYSSDDLYPCIRRAGALCGEALTKIKLRRISIPFWQQRVGRSGSGFQSREEDGRCSL